MIKRFFIQFKVEQQSGYSHYLAENGAIGLADEVLRYCDHDTSDMQQSKRHSADNGSRIVVRNG